MSVRLAVFASGSGSNLQALLDHEATSSHWEVGLVVSDRSDAFALERARRADREARVVPVQDRGRDEVAEDTLEVLRRNEIDAVLLAGYLRLVPGPVVRRYRRRMLNIHPALLPAFGGKGMYGRRVHEEVLRAGAKVTGVTIHFVDDEYDSGTIFAQWPVPVHPDDTAEELASRVLRVEHLLYPRATDHFCRALEEGREPDSFRLPGEIFLLPPDASDGELGRQIRRAFNS